MSSKKSFGHRAKKWFFAFIKFNIVGFIVFLVATAIYGLAFGTFGAWTWLIASGIGGILQFSLISYLNTTRIGKIFDSCEQRKNNIQETSKESLKSSSTARPKSNSLQELNL